MRRLTTALTVVGALTATMAGPPAGAQIPDVPPLGFTISPTDGAVGSQVSGTVAVADVAELCITDREEFVAQFANLEEPFEGPAPYLDAVRAFVNEVYAGNVFENGDVANNPTDFAAAAALAFPLGLWINRPSQGGTGALIDAAMAQTFVMAFADIATASPIDPLGSFDSSTGAGSVEVPNIAPGNQPVIATCVGVPEGLTVADIRSAVDAGAAFVEANLEAPFPDAPEDPAFAELAARVAPSIVREVVQPRSLGIQFFCVHDASGACPAGPAPMAPPATPVPGRPAFTG